jgi:hypothetical protein
MFCPQCGSTQSDQLKFCKACGANLGIVKEALDSGKAPGKFDWGNTWVAEMFASSEESVRREKELERLKGITPEVKRRNEIKAGVIVASIGIGLMVFLYIFMQGIILSGRPSPGEAEILSRIWIAGIIPLMIGIALIINGAFVSKLFSRSEQGQKGADAKELAGNAPGEYLPPADTSPLFQAGFSVTDETTAHLKEPARKRS